MATLTIKDNEGIDIDQGLIGYWPFENSADDQSGTGNNGQWIGTPSYDVGYQGLALSTDGTSNGSYVLVPHSSSLDGMSELSIVFWARKHTGAPRNRVIYKHLSYALEVQPDRFNGMLYNDNGEQGSFYVIQNSIDDTLWHHYGVTYDGTAIIVYIDGVAVDTVGFSGNIAVNPTRDLYLGKDPWGNSFNGLLDEVRIYNRALSAEEIELLSTGNVSILTFSKQDFSKHLISKSASTSVIYTFNGELVSITGNLQTGIYLLRSSDGSLKKILLIK